MATTHLLIYPTLDEVKRQALKAGLPEIEAEKFWNHHEAHGWRWGRNQPIKSWLNSLQVWKLNWLERSGTLRTGTNGKHLSGPQIVLFGEEYKRVLMRLRDLEGSITMQSRAEARQLRTRSVELRGMLGIMV